ncbi:MAG: GntR family transcriptional regulator [Lentisphaerae bacterium]|nr:GntR family transcriptional regulator [Lentisphaerota bacterium]
MNIFEFINIESSSTVPIYRQVIEGVEKFCAAAVEGDPIPSERELCEKLEISRTILRQALNECVERGLLVKRWGKGNFVGPKERQKRILIILASEHNDADPFQYIMPGIEARARELSIKLEILPLQFICDKSEEFVTAMLEREKFTGILFLNYICGLELPALKAFRKTRTPLYWPHVLEDWAQTERFYCGCVDTRKTFLEAMQMLIGHGARRIATIAKIDGGREYDFSGIRGYSTAEFLALQEQLGVDADPELILNSPYDKASIYAALDRLAGKRKKFDAVLCMSDFYAIHVMSWLKAHHFRIPEDVAVMGYCGYPGGKFMEPPLSTIDYQYYQIGYNAVDRLLQIAAQEPSELPPGGVLDYSPCIACLRGSVQKMRNDRSENCYEIKSSFAERPPYRKRAGKQRRGAACLSPGE